MNPFWGVLLVYICHSLLASIVRRTSDFCNNLKFGLGGLFVFQIWDFSCLFVLFPVQLNFQIGFETEISDLVNEKKGRY